LYLCTSVVSFSSKNAGKNDKHSDITESSNIAAVSNLAVQLFQYRDFGRQFCSIPNATAIFQTRQYLLISSIQFLYLLDTKLSSSQPSAPSIELLAQDIECYKDLKQGEKEITQALKLAKKTRCCGE
jgi:hypothetical protein